MEVGGGGRDVGLDGVGGRGGGEGELVGGRRRGVCNSQ